VPLLKGKVESSKVRRHDGRPTSATAGSGEVFDILDAAMRLRDRRTGTATPSAADL
jgi:hypothetical protein